MDDVTPPTYAARSRQTPRGRRESYDRPHSAFRRVLAVVFGTLLILGGAATVQTVAGPGASAASSTFNLALFDATTGQPIVGKNFKFLINEDNTGQTTQRTPADGCSPASPDYGSPAADSCLWTSMGINSSSAVVTQGDQGDFPAGFDLPDGRYLVSVLADGYKLDGVHFSVPIPGDGTVAVTLQPQPLPDSTIQALVFEDISPTNSGPDVPAERGLAGFTAILNDNLGQITTDVYGNPLCTEYDGNGDPIAGTGGNCVSKCYATGDVVVPAEADGRCPVGTLGKLIIHHVGTNRYALALAPPVGSSWVQTTTLEGNHDWDTWIMEGSTGLDTEFVQAAEPMPPVIFGYVRRGVDQLPAGPSGAITGRVNEVKMYFPPKGGVSLPGEIFGGLQGGKLGDPISNPWISLSDLRNGDTTVWVGQGDATGAFTIPDVPDGTYMLSWWDEDQNYILNWQQVAVTGGQVLDLGVLPLNGWWTRYTGVVFNDLDRDGVRDPGENGIPNFTIVIKKRDNSLMDRGGRVVTTTADGSFTIPNAYPMTQWYVMEAYNDRFYTTGVSYQADNEPAPTTVMADRDPAGDPNGTLVGTGVDVNTLPIIGLSGNIDWGVHAYDPSGATGGKDPRNGGIVGTVSYDTTRNELNPQFAAVEDWQPGVKGVTVNLWDTVPCGTTTTTTCDSTGRYELNPADGSFAKGARLNTAVTETWEQPQDCVARDVDGNPLLYPVDQQVLPTASPSKCLEGPMMGVQFDDAWATVDGNYGFTEGCAAGVVEVAGEATCTAGFQPLLGAHDYLVEIVVPKDDVLGRDTYTVTKEEDINVGNGDEVVPQVPPPSCAGPLHRVDVAGTAPGTDNYPASTVPVVGGGVVNVPASTPVTNNSFLDLGGSPYEGMATPLCSTKLVNLPNGRSVAPTFNVFTDVPLPTRFWGLVVDDLNFSADPKSLLFGEKAGVPFAPVGIYDYTNRLVYTAESDYNGLFDVLLPSTNRINCPTPSGVCPNLYRFVGNDPGIPGRLNLNYKPQFRTIAADFEAIPGVNIIADLAPTQVGVTVQLPTGQFNQVSCKEASNSPQIFLASRVHGSSAAERTVTLTGLGFGATAGAVLVDDLPVNATSWTDTSIAFEVPANPGPHQITVRASNGLTSVNGITFHVLGAGYSPQVLEVGPGTAYPPVNSLPATANHAIQDAIDDAPAGAIVVVHPGVSDGDPRSNPRGAYFENLIINKPIKLQGMGPGGVYAGGGTVRGSIIDGGAYGGDSPVGTDWLTKVASPPYDSWVGNQTLTDGAVITLLSPTATTFAASPNPADQLRIDGFDIRGGDQFGFPTNLNVINGLPTGLPANVVTQGGAVYANDSVRALQLTNNLVQNNGGAYGTIRIGTPNLADSNNDNVRIANNRIIHNAGTNLAGGIGIFAGADGYEVSGNDICGNFSAEYGGGLTVYGRSPNGRIAGNRIYFNASYDEAGGVMIAGELPAVPGTESPGTGAVTIDSNLIQANLGNDDGGGLRFLMAGRDLMTVTNNMIVNNVSTHEGGGVSINDTTNVRVVNNTIMKNITTSTALTSNGLPAPAGLSSSLTSAVLGGGFANPVLFNNIFWDNRAGTRAGTTVTGIGIAGDATPINNSDIGVADGGGALLSPTYSILQTPALANPSATNRSVDPGVVATYDTSVAFQVWRNNPAFVGALLVAVDAPANLLGNYHLTPTSPAVNVGAASVPGVAAPAEDIDGDLRPSSGGYEMGADELPAPTGPPVDLRITKQTTTNPVQPDADVRYVLTVSKGNVGASPNGAVTGVSVVDNLPSTLSNATWTCASSNGATCTAAGGTGSVATLVNLGTSANSSVTITIVARLAATATGTLTNVATVAPPANRTESNPSNNTATLVSTIQPRPVNLRITKTDGQLRAVAGSRVSYSIVVDRVNGNGAINGVVVTDTPSIALADVSWTCAPATRCTTTSGNGPINTTVNLNTGNATATFTLTGTIAPGATGLLQNTATVAAPPGWLDTSLGNNTATDTDLLVSPAFLLVPQFQLIENFGGTGTLPNQWTQPTGSNITRLNNVAVCTACPSGGRAYLRGNNGVYAARQGASIQIVDAPTAGNPPVSLVMKATGGQQQSNPTNYLRVSVTPSGVNVATTTDAGATFQQWGTIPATFAAGDTLAAVADQFGNVHVYRGTTYLGTVTIALTGAISWPLATGGGRIGIQMPQGQRLDNLRARDITL